MSNFDPTQWAIATPSPNTPYQGDFGTIRLQSSRPIASPRTKGAGDLYVEFLNAKSRAKWASRVATGLTLELDHTTVDAERLVQFIADNPGCKVRFVRTIDKVVLTCPDIETAALAGLSL